MATQRPGSRETRGFKHCKGKDRRVLRADANDMIASRSTKYKCWQTIDSALCGAYPGQSAIREGCAVPTGGRRNVLGLPKGVDG